MKRVALVIAACFLIAPFPRASATLSLVATNNVGASINSIDWSVGDRYIAVASVYGAGADQLTVFRFQTNAIPRAITNDYGLNIDGYAVRWHATSLYLALGTEANGTGPELFVYQITTNNILQTTNTFEVADVCAALAWRGGDLTIGTESWTGEVRTLTYSPGSLTLSSSLNISGNREVQPNAMDWTTVSTNLAVGLNDFTSDLQVFRIVSGALGDAETVSELAAVTAVDWHPNGRFLAVGLANAAAAEDLRIYEFNSTNRTLTYLTSATNGLAGRVTTVDWSPTGDILAVGTDEMTEDYIREYRFYTTNKTLRKLGEVPVAGDPVRAVRWSRSGSYLAAAHTGEDLGVYRLLNANLSVTKTGAPPVVGAGSNLVYTVVVSNAGPDVVPILTLTDLLPTNVSFTTATVTTGTWSLVTGSVVCVFSNFPVNSRTTVTVDVVVSPSALGAITNLAYVEGSIADLSESNNTATFVSYLDFDGDGIRDTLDNCLTLPNPSQTDSDSDGRGNDCDNCPTNSNASQVDGDGDGSGDVCDLCPTNAFEINVDSDGDGRGDSCDNCPSVVNPTQMDTDLDGLGDLCDSCPTNANTGDVDGDLIDNSCDPDIDGDQLPNTWEVTHGFTPFDPSLPDTFLDPDGDGSLNIEEFIAGTDATNVVSFFGALVISNVPPVRVYFPSITGRVYALDGSTNLEGTSWTAILTNQLGVTGVGSIPDTNPAPLRAYRVRVRMAP